MDVKNFNFVDHECEDTDLDFRFETNTEDVNNKLPFAFETSRDIGRWDLEGIEEDGGEYEDITRDLAELRKMGARRRKKEGREEEGGREEGQNFGETSIWTATGT